MKAIIAILILGLVQRSADRSVYMGDPVENVGGFSIHLEEGWSAKLPGQPIDKHLTTIREPDFIGPRGATMKVMWLLKPDPEILKLLPAELDEARTRNPDDFRPINLHGRIGGLFVTVHRAKGEPPVWIVAKMTDGKELLDVTITADRKFKQDEMDRIEAMIRSIEPHR